VQAASANAVQLVQLKVFHNGPECALNKTFGYRGYPSNRLVCLDFSAGGKTERLLGSWRRSPRVAVGLYVERSTVRASMI
jgi:hypothetical protein